MSFPAILALESSSSPTFISSKGGAVGPLNIPNSWSKTFSAHCASILDRICSTMEGAEVDSSSLFT